MSHPIRQAKILVVDDVEDLCQLIAWRFSALGHQVFTATNPQDGLRIALAEDVDFVITDKEMPDGDGLELLAKLKAINVARPIVFIMTASTGPVAEMAYAMGAEGAFLKPFNAGVLTDAVERFMEPALERPAQAQPEILRLASPLKITVDKARNEPCIVGRGGIFVVSSALPPRGQHLAFTLEISGMRQNPSDAATLVDGVGIVRWTRAEAVKAPSGFGLEFDYLPKEARRYLATWSASQGIIPFIPKG